jgi:antitoxin HicB
MALLSYPVVLVEDNNDTILVDFPDFPECHTFGDDAEDALAHAVDALESVIMGRMAGRKDIPLPSPARGRPTVTLPLQSAIKTAIYQAMRQRKMTKARLARKMGWNPPQVDRLLSLRHRTRLDLLEQALAALGKKAEVRILEAA